MVFLWQKQIKQKRKKTEEFFWTKNIKLPKIFDYANINIYKQDN